MEIKKKKYIRAMVAFLAFVLCLPLLLSQKTYATDTEEEKTVRIGYYPVENFQGHSEDGSYSGYGYDYYMQIQKYTRWNYEFVEASYADCLKMLASGKIDIVSGLVETPARSEQMLFSKHFISDMQNELYALADAPLYYEDYEEFNGCKVAILKGSLHTEIDAYCAEHDFQVDIVEYDSMTDMQAALASGEVDMMFTASVSSDSNTKIVARMDKIPLYYGVSKSRPDILEELDDALQKIVDNNPNFYTQMSEKYMVSGSNAAATFTKDELEYIKSGQEVYVIMNAYWAPISWYDSETGTFRGIVVDVLDKIKEYCGLKFVYYTEDEFNALVVEHPEMENNVLAILADDNTWAVNQNVFMTNHIVDASVVMVTKRSTHQTQSTEDMRIALPYRFYISWCMRNDFPEEQVTYYDTVEDCLRAINEGKADATFVNELVATYYLSMLEYSNLFATANSAYDENLAFAVYKDSDQPLLGIIDKSLLCIDSKDMKQIVITNSIAEQRASLKGLVYSNPALFVIMALLMVSIIFTAYVMHARRVRVSKELGKDAETSAARTEFFMMISHELRTPLNAVVGYLNLAAEQCKGNGLETEYLNRSRQAAKQLSRIAEDMLDYTQIASNSTNLKNEIFDLKNTIWDLEQNISVEAEKKGVDFEFTLHDVEHEYVVGDNLRLLQIMQNILSNAVKFTDKGGHVKADVTQQKTEEGNLEFIFKAEDTGRGMSEEYLEKVCAPFQQDDKAYSRTHGGLGLGLYLTKYYLDAMGGRMEVTSALGQGSCFIIYLPLKLASTSQVVEEKVDLSYVRVMIGGIDEEENKQLKTTLKRFGIKSDIQTEGDKLIKRILSRSTGDYAYSLCLLDEKLLDTDTNLLKTISELNMSPKIFVLTASTKQQEMLSEKSEISHVLYKPIFQSVLLNAILEEFGEYKVDDKNIPEEDFEGIRVMIVEDNKINSDILMRILKRANIEVDLYENGSEAVEAFNASKAGTYKVILMDIQMPVMNGYEATMAIRSGNHPEAKDIPIIAVSANAFPEDIEKSLKCGMNEHLSKPIKTKQLYQTIRKHLPAKEGEIS